MADHLSKHEMQDVMKIWPEGLEWPGQTSRVLKAWIESPKVMMDLCWKLHGELSERREVHVGRDYRKDMMRAKSGNLSGMK